MGSGTLTLPVVRLVTRAALPGKLFLYSDNYRHNMKVFLLLLVLAYSTCGQDTFLVYPTQESGRQAKVLTDKQADASVLFNLDGLFEDEEDRGAKNVDVDKSVDLDSVAYEESDVLEEDFEKEEDIEELARLDEK